jgi:hypothetical protein
MTKFSDQLFDDLMREHGQALAGVRAPAARRRHVPRPVMLTAGAGGLAAVAAVGTLVAGGAAPAYAVTTHSDGTVTLAVYQKSGITQANAKLRQVGDGRVVVVPVEPGCPSINSLSTLPGKPGTRLKLSLKVSTGGGATVDARGVPAGETLVVAFAATTANGKGMIASSSALTTGPVPGCVSIPRQPPGGAPGHGTGVGTGGPGIVTRGGTGPDTSSNG